jgi:hypothetical protein
MSFKRAKVAALLCAALITIPVVCARPFTGTFIADERPGWIGLLSLRQADQGVKGFLVIAESTRDGKTSSKTITVEGFADADMLTLESKSFLNLSSVTFSGQLGQGRILLSFPTSSGRIQMIKFVRASEAEYNTRLAGWQHELRAAYLKKQSEERNAAVKRQKTEAAVNSVAKLRHNIPVLAQAIEELKGDAPLTQHLSSCRNTLESLQRYNIDILRRSSSTTCSYLESQVDYGRSQLDYLGSQRSYFDDRANDIDEKTSELLNNVSELENLLAMLNGAAASDPANTYSPAQVKEMTNATRQFVQRARVELAQIANTVREARRTADAFVARARANCEDTAQRAKTAACRRDD